MGLYGGELNCHVLIPTWRPIRRGYQQRTPWGKTLLEKLMLPYLVKNFLVFCDIRRLMTVFIRPRYLPNRHYIEPKESSSHFYILSLKININIIISSKGRCPKWFPPFRFSSDYYLYEFSIFPCVLYAPPVSSTIIIGYSMKIRDGIAQSVWRLARGCTTERSEFESR
jgi:hypothetical protein